MNYFRLFIGLGTAVVAGWVLFGEQLAGASADATINARVTTLRATLNGNIDFPRREVGTAISFGEELAQITNADMDETEAEALAMESGELTAESARLESEIAALQAASGNGALSEARQSELVLETLRLSARRNEVTDRLAAIGDRQAAVRNDMNRARSDRLRSNVDGQVWDVLVSPGELVSRGQAMLRLLDCDTAIVTASVTESVYNTLRVGDRVVFRETGQGRRFDGSIIRLAGTGAATLYASLAVPPTEQHLERFDVAVLVPGLRSDPVLRCAVGRTGRIFFADRPLDLVRRVWN